MSTQIESFDLTPFYIQSGYGIPDHYSTLGSEYTDLNTVIKYVNQNGLNYWVEMGNGSGGGSFTGGTITGPSYFTNGLTATTISATTYLNLPLDVKVTGSSLNPTTYDFTLARNDGVNITSNLGILASDMNVTGGTYNINTGIITFTNNSGGTFNVTGFTSGMTDTYTTGGTVSSGTATFTKTNGGTYTVTGFATGNTISNGTTNYLSKFTGATSLGNSLIYDDGTNVGIGTSSPSSKLTIQSNTSQDSVTLGAELTTTASGTDWVGASLVSGYTHTAGSVVVLTSTFLPSINTFYRAVITVTNRTAGSVTTNVGGAIDFNRTSGTISYSFSALSTIFTCTPSTDFDGTVSVSVKQMSPILAITDLKNSSGTTFLETRLSPFDTNTNIGKTSGRYNSGFFNTGFGYQALRDNTGNFNTAFGANSLASIAGASYNTAFGYNVFGGSKMSVGNVYNIGVGGNIGSSNFVGGGFGNIFIGWNVATSAALVVQNTFMGYNSGTNATTGSNNLLLGAATGGALFTTNSNSVLVGASATPSATGNTNEIVIGQGAVGIGSNTVVLGNNNIVTTALKGNIAIGATTAGARLDVRAQGALSTDIAFRVRNSADTENIISVLGNQDINFALNSSQTASFAGAGGGKLLLNGESAAWISGSALIYGNSQNILQLRTGGNPRLEIDSVGKITIPSSLSANTISATTFNGFVPVKTWKSGIDGATVSNTLTITPVYTQLIPAGTFVADDVVEVIFRATAPNAKTAQTNSYIYLNTVNNLTGSPVQVAIFNTTSTGRTVQLQRALAVKGSTTRVINPAGAIATDTVQSAAMTALTIDWTVNQYFIFAIGHTTANPSETLFGDFYRIIKN